MLFFLGDNKSTNLLSAFNVFGRGQEDEKEAEGGVGRHLLEVATFSG